MILICVHFQGIFWYFCNFFPGTKILPTITNKNLNENFHGQFRKFILFTFKLFPSLLHKGLPQSRNYDGKTKGSEVDKIKSFSPRSILHGIKMCRIRMPSDKAKLIHRTKLFSLHQKKLNIKFYLISSYFASS